MSSSSGDRRSSHATLIVLDRDGTVVVDRDYLDDPDELELLPGAAEGLRLLHQGGFRMIVVSNQSGVGRGLFSLRRLEEINARLLQMVRLAGADLEGIYCCPHQPEDGCACRKPGTELLLHAALDLGFDPKESIVIGDKASDIELGRRVGARTLLISADPDQKARLSPSPDYVVADLAAAARLIELLHAEASTAARTSRIA